MRPSSAKSTTVAAVVLLAGVLPLLASVGAHRIFGDGQHVQDSLHGGRK